MNGFDYIVIGGGSAGCVIAARLSEDPAAKVLLLEAGPDNNSWKINVPLGLGAVVPKKNDHNWGFIGEPEPHLENRRIFCPRGRGLGGSSAINGMVYIRGNSADYDRWRQMGLRGWGYDDVLPYFKKSEDHVDGESAFHGKGGPLHITHVDAGNPLNQAFIAAGAEAGYPCSPDFNGGQQEGFGWYDCNIRGGRRASSAVAFLKPASGRPNLTVKSGAHVTRIIVASGRATAVEFVDGPGGIAQTAHADREVVLSAGAIQSPHILQLSGIGDPGRLGDAGIRTLHDLPGVGANLHDHLDVGVINQCTQRVTLHSAMSVPGALRMGLQYLLFKKGPAATAISQVGAFVKSRPDLELPDMQAVIVPLAIAAGRPPPKDGGFTFHFCQLDPESRGHVSARSADPFEGPKILFNYLATQYDRDVLRQCVKAAREVIAQPALDAFRGAEIAPGPDVRTDGEIDAWVRAHASTVFHPVGSCRMGLADDPMAVVDDQLCVRGIDGLRIADASVMPTIVRGNTNAPAMMIGEKAARLIAG